MKKVLIVSRSFYPANSPRSFRATELTKELAREGHDVTVLTSGAEGGHSLFESKYHVKIKYWGRQSWKSLSISGGAWTSIFNRVLVRIPKLLVEYPDIELTKLVGRALKKESGYDLLISIAVPYPVHWGVAIARSDRHRIATTWIADCGDPYMGAENDSFKPPFYFKYVEKWFMRKADYITVPSQGSIGGYYPEFRPKIRVIPQGFRFEDYQFEHTDLRKDYPIFGYGGMFIPQRRDPTELIRYLAGTNEKFQFRIYTTTPAIVQKALPQEDERFVLLDPIPREELLKAFGHLDFVVNFENKGSTQLPSKLIDYAILDKPILSVKTRALNTHVVDEFLRGDYTNRKVIEDRDQYRIENVVKRFLKLSSSE